MTRDDAALIRALLPSMYQHDIAALFDCNMGRVAEIARRQKFAGVAPADLKHPAVARRVVCLLADHHDKLNREVRKALGAAK
ncbi:hypothetical protein [Rhodopseudomonas faecalis]|uniref:hypothetical protein n=1 Tax=Rhodopseudomonas faecalis TaxID=99655 RepID=UPI0011B7FE13|nr:hypothetical protein [Rhodopseudomonas faecalis]